MKNLLFLLLFIPAFATAQINGTIQKTASSGTVRGSFGSAGIDTLAKKADLNLKANLASPALTGTPTAPTATAGTNTTQIATTAFVTAGIAASGGVTTMATIGAVPNANGASISGNTLTLQPASVSFGGLTTTGTQSYAGLKTFTTGVAISSGGLEVTGGGLTVTGTGTPTILQSSTSGLIAKLERTGTASVAYVGTLNNGFLAANSSGSTVFEARSDGWLSNPNSGGSGDVLIGADNNGIFRKVVIGSGLSYSAGTLTATGGTSGTITGSGTAGMITKFTGAGAIGNSIMTEATNNISINGTDGTNQLDLLSGGNSRLSMGYISSVMQIYSRNLLPIRLGVEAGTNGVNITNGGGTDISSNGAPLTLSSLNSNTFKATLRDITTVMGYLGATATDAFVVGSSAAATLMTVNNSTGAVTASSFVGALSGNANTATALQTARTISGTSFDGTGNITLNNTGITNGAGYITASSTNTLTNKSGNISQWTNDSGYAVGSFTGYATESYVNNIVSSGSYTPGLTNETNITSSSLIGNATYSKVGNIVHISLTVNITPTASATNTVLYFALPSGLNAAVSSGSGVSVASQGGPSGVVQYQSSTGGKVTFVSSSTSVLTHYIQFDYSL